MKGYFIGGRNSRTFSLVSLNIAIQRLELIVLLFTLPAEANWIGAIERAFYNVGFPLANYMICDWLLWFWIRGDVEWFTSFKADSVQKRTLAEMLDLPQTETAFVEYCRAIRVPKAIGIGTDRPLPPRLLNECIWLERNKSSRPEARI